MSFHYFWSNFAIRKTKIKPWFWCLKEKINWLWSCQEQRYHLCFLVVCLNSERENWIWKVNNWPHKYVLHLRYCNEESFREWEHFTESGKKAIPNGLPNGYLTTWHNSVIHQMSTKKFTNTRNKVSNDTRKIVLSTYSVPDIVPSTSHLVSTLTSWLYKRGSISFIL